VLLEREENAVPVAILGIALDAHHRDRVLPDVEKTLQVGRE
jgi:hypothetical protein